MKIMKNEFSIKLSDLKRENKNLKLIVQDVQMKSRKFTKLLKSDN